MEFEFTGTLWIELSDLRMMYERVKKGEDFHDVYYDIMNGYDDVDYYVSDYAEENVRKEIYRRLEENKRGERK